MPPLSKLKEIELAPPSVFNFKQGRVVVALLVILVTATIARIVVVYILQKRSQTAISNLDASEKQAPKHVLKRQDSGVCQDHWECDHNNYLNSLKQELLAQNEKPIHPWISPPQALPGPYDPMYYPLPAPSFRPKSPPFHPANSEGRHSTSYIRHVPRANVPINKAVLYGTMTVSTNGWRRSHWNVTGG